MTSTTATKRGPYAKGREKREQILQRALDVIGREGYRGASVKELAEAVGLSQAGLLHYFGSKEELFTEILRKRDEVDVATFEGATPTPRVEDLRSWYVKVVRHNADVPGLVELFSQLAVEAADPNHPARSFFLQRSEFARTHESALFSHEQAEGSVRREVSPEVLARLLQAVSDGIQIQWLLEPDLDMAEVVDAFFELITPEKSRLSAPPTG